MQLLKKIRKQKVVYWGPPVNTGDQMKFPYPVECKCRWDDKTGVIQLRKGGEYISGATVLMDRIVVEDGYLLLGTLADMLAKYADCVDPREIGGALIIKRTETLPLLGAKNLTNINKVAHWAYL